MSPAPFLTTITILTLPGLALAQSGDRARADASPAHARAAASTCATKPVPTAKLHVSVPLDSRAWLVPIHTNTDDPEGGRYGIWAAGATFKVSFHDGFVFYPVLGTAYPENLPLRWTTKDVRLGKTSILDTGAVPKTWSSDWRYEYRYPGLTEAYDVLDKGVEQTFVIHEKPTGKGDLVVTGVVGSKLVAHPRQAVHGPIEFADSAGETILKYGAAFAYDKSGRRTEVTTSYDGERVELTLSGEWLAEATFPVTIDPLTSRVAISTWGKTYYGSPSYPDVCRDDDSNRLLTVYSRVFSSSDYDTYARRTTDAFGGSQVIFSDVTSGWSSRYNQCCHNSGPNYWAIVLCREYTSSCAVCVYTHLHTSTVANSGKTRYVARPSGTQDQMPSIGGVGGDDVKGNNVYVAWRRDTGTGAPNNVNSKVYGCTLNVLTGSFGTQRRLSASATTSDEDFPCVTKASLGGDWIVCWQEYNPGIKLDDWDVRVARVTTGGVITGRSELGPAANTNHKLCPKVAGAKGRYLVSFTQQANTGKSGLTRGHIVSCQRFDWAGNVLKKLPVVDLWRGVQDSVSTGVGNRSISYDTNTQSHWAVACDNYKTRTCTISRVGHSGCRVEAAFLYGSSKASGYSPSVVYNDDSYEFAVVYATRELPASNQPVYGARLSYDPSAGCVPLGSGCAGTIRCYNRGPRTNPYAGSEFFQVGLTSGVPRQPYGLFVSNTSTSVPLPGPGGCRLHIGPGVLVMAASGVTNGLGSYTTGHIPLPDCPSPFLGKLYAQWFTVVGGQLRSTNAMQMTVQ